MTFSEILFSKSKKSLVHKDFSFGRMLAWEAVVLPIYEPCVGYEWHYSRWKCKIQSFSVGCKLVCVPVFGKFRVSVEIYCKYGLNLGSVYDTI